jgi:putative membrane protein
VLLSGVLRFSLLYIALIYSGLQLIDPDPVRLAEMLSRNRADRLIFLMSESPVASGAAVVFAAALLSWISGIAVNLNRYYRFRAWLTDGKLQKRHGLLTVAEATIPLKKVQAVIFRSNPLMMRLGWWAVEAQTMGLDVRQQGHQMAVPLAKLQVARRVGAAILPIRPLSDYMSVSPRFVRRATFRYSLALLAMSAPIGYWQPQLLFGTPLLIPLAYWFARAQYRQHGYDVDDEWLRVRRGVIRHMEWHVPLRYAHVFYTSQTLFQRRLGLKTLYVDTAGASPVSYPAILDLPQTTADQLRRTLYRRFQEVLEASAGLPGSSSPADVRSEQMPR